MKPCFKVLNDPLLIQASAELLPIGLEQVFDKRDYTFFRVDPQNLIDYSPSLKAYLEKVNLLDKLHFSAVPLCPPRHAGLLHKDMTYPEAINLPIYSCADSYFCWYDAEPVFEVPRQTMMDDKRSDRDSGYATDSFSHIEYKTDTAKEIARVSCALPVWFNTQMPHRPINYGNMPRVIATLRFSCMNILEYLE